MSATLELEAIACPLCEAPDATVLCSERDLALGVPGRFPLFGRHGSALDFPRHLIHFTPVTMRALIRHAGPTA